MQLDLDDADRQLLAALQANARLTSSELAQQVGLSQSPCWRRIRRLEESGLVEGYHARLNRRQLGYGVVAFVLVSLDFQNEARSMEFVEAVRDIPQVVMFHGITGAADFLLMVLAEDLESYSTLLQTRLHRLPGVRQVQTSFSINEFRPLGDLPIPSA
ncbi:MAG: Lrp/AsnC family transcriptional regulator [Proteobacteria bacterium]|nr:Lrp/AsnC family transcriptional regulator [Pseudomonadota bacterium]